MRKTSISCENVGSCAVLSVSYAEARPFLFNKIAIRNLCSKASCNNEF